MRSVIIIMGSASDLPALKPCIETLKEFGVPFEVNVASAHRTPELVHEIIAKGHENNAGVFICAAGKAAHLAGNVAAQTCLPVIGIPVKSSTLDGLDALLSTVQMPSGIPVATVAIDGAQNAALLAVQILGISDKNLSDKLVEYKKKMSDSVIEADKKIKQEI